MTSKRPVRWGTLAAFAAAIALGIGAQTAVAAKRKPARTASAQGDRAPDAMTYGHRADVLRFGVDVAERRGLDVGWVERALSHARYLPGVVRLIMPAPSGTTKNWAAYRERFVEPVRIEAGVDFWRAQRQWLALAEQTYGVPPEIVVGIIGVETFYGRHMGRFRVIDALATLAFDYPPIDNDRSAFFRDELENFLVLCHAEGFDPGEPKGSYAGAMGLPQFMPSSFNRYAVDLDGDGVVDLRRSAADAIGSVAHYLAEFGWKRGLPTHFEVAPPSDPAELALLLAPDIVPQFTPAEFLAHGALLSEAGLESTGPLALVELQNGDDQPPSFVAGTTNFYVVTRYNRSSYYALAVIELGAAVAHERSDAPR